MLKTKRLKIGFVVYRFPCISETFILNQIVKLIELGHEVDIFAFEKSREHMEDHEKILKYNLLDRVVYLHTITIPEKRKERIKLALCIILRHIFKNPFWIKRCLNFRKYGKYQSLNLLFRAEPFMKKRYDIIHCQYGSRGKELIFLKDILRAKIVTSFRGYDISRFIKDNHFDIYNELFHRGDGFLPVCRYFGTRLFQLGCPEEKIKIMHSGIDLEEFPYVQRNFNFSKSIKILTVGRLVEKKGIQYAIFAVNKMAKKYKNIQYTIIGEGIQKSMLEHLIKKLNIENNVKLRGNLGREDVRKYFFESDIFILPCTTAGNGDQEGIPNVLKEAMATGMPIISTYHSGIPELVADGESGFLVPERSVETLTQRLEYLIEHPEVCQRMGEAGRKFVEENFNIKKLSRELVQFYQQLLDNRCV